MAREVPAINKLVQNGGYAYRRDNRPLISKNFHSSYIPASTIKLVTSLAALDILGPDYQFTTSFYLDPDHNLTIYGTGDPFLVSEKVKLIIDQLQQLGLRHVHDLILDDSAFALESATDGSGDSFNPYDAQCSAIGVNFNTIPVRVIHNGKVQSLEPQTPYLPIMGRLAKVLPSGSHRVNLNAFPADKTISNKLLTCGQLFKAFLQASGIRMTGEIRRGRVSADSDLLLKYRGVETVRELIRSMLLSSSNFMANQLYLAVGIRQFGVPGTWAKGQKALNAYIHNSLGLPSSQIHMVEGSGLSTNTRITPGAMLQVLEKFRPYAALLPKKYGVQMKSGTLRDSGVFCYAGYIPKKNWLQPFVIFLNQRKNTRDAILRLLYRL